MIHRPRKKVFYTSPLVHPLLFVEPFIDYSGIDLTFLPGEVSLEAMTKQSNIIGQWSMMVTVTKPTVY